ncbi:MAG: hypothetical protein Ta2A_11250 [Treponemataceae bacterium]|nr:MAG: hypothetical protein Ta2A_11250 [Treponemataceae bacterium]
MSTLEPKRVPKDPAPRVLVGWENFITGGGEVYNADETPPPVIPPLPVWDPRDPNPVDPQSPYTRGTMGPYSLWDYFGFPINWYNTYVIALSNYPYGTAFPLDFWRRGYNFIYNEYYRDENFQSKIALDNQAVLQRCWEKDYFTSALPWQQKGKAPALPVHVSLQGVGIGVPGGNPNQPSWVGAGNNGSEYFNAASTALPIPNSTNVPQPFVADGEQTTSTWRVQFNNRMNANVDLLIDGKLSTAYLQPSDLLASTFDVSDLRNSFAVQRWLERNARCGTRYTEFLGAHYGTHPRDERLQRPEYIGGSKSPIIISEVRQTGATESISPQGNLAGYGITADRTFAASYTASEFGYVFALLSIMPRTVYSDGFPREALRRDKFDFYTPEFAHVSEQAILKSEIYANTASVPLGDEITDDHIWGYTGAWDEMRQRRSLVTGKLKLPVSGAMDGLNFWHLARYFDDMPEMNDSFLRCNKPSSGFIGMRLTDRVFAVQDEPGFIVNIQHLIRAVRPLPIMSEPGLIDHV